MTKHKQLPFCVALKKKCVLFCDSAQYFSRKKVLVVMVVEEVTSQIKA